MFSFQFFDFVWCTDVYCVSVLQIMETSLVFPMTRGVSQIKSRYWEPYKGTMMVRWQGTITTLRD